MPCRVHVWKLQFSSHKTIDEVKCLAPRQACSTSWKERRNGKISPRMTKREDVPGRVPVEQVVLFQGPPTCSKGGDREGHPISTASRSLGFIRGPNSVFSLPTPGLPLHSCRADLFLGFGPKITAQFSWGGEFMFSGLVDMSPQWRQRNDHTVIRKACSPESPSCLPSFFPLPSPSFYLSHSSSLCWVTPTTFLWQWE
jgi:hypothetical protein